MAAKIDSFTGPYRFLSNFFPCPISYQAILYNSVEHAYQAAKTRDQQARIDIAGALTPGIAKRMGRLVKLRPDWDLVKLDVMKELLLKKFSHGSLRQLLLDTGNAELVEGNGWGDRFWGRVAGQGHNHLGRLLMEVREEVRYPVVGQFEGPS